MLTYRIFMRDLQDLARSHVFLAILILVPLGLLLLIGQVDVRPIVTRVAIVTDPEDTTVEEIHDSLREISSVEWVDWPADAEQIAARAVRQRVDLVVVKSEGDWQVYEAITHAWRAPSTREVAQLLMFELARQDALDARLGKLREIKRELSTEDEVTSIDVPRALRELQESAMARGATEDESRLRQVETFNESVTTALTTTSNLVASEETDAALPPAVLSAGLSSTLTSLLGFEISKVHALVPGYIVLIGVFVSFVLGSLSIVRERANGTLPSLLVGTRRRWHTVAFGKLCLPVLAGTMISALLIVAARLAFNLGIKPGLSGALATLLLAVTASGLVGLALSAWLDSAQEAYAACAIYLVCLILLTGMVHPIEQSAPIAVAIAHLFSFTVAAPAMEEWMAAGALGLPPWDVWRVLGLQILGAMVLCAGAFARLKQRV